MDNFSDVIFFYYRLYDTEYKNKITQEMKENNLYIQLDSEFFIRRNIGIVFNYGMENIKIIINGKYSRSKER